MAFSLVQWSENANGFRHNGKGMSLPAWKTSLRWLRRIFSDGEDRIL